MNKSLITALILAIAGALPALAQEAKPTWQLSKNAIDPASIHGKIECVDGIVKLDTVSSFAIPAAVLGAQNDYTIEFELRRSPNFKTLPHMEGALRLVCNRDATAHAGLSLIYFPPAWDLNGGVGNLMGSEVNCYWNVECGGLDGTAFNKYSIVVKDRLASIYRNGLLMAMTGGIKPSQMPLTVGGKGWRGDFSHNKSEGGPVPEPYELRSLKIYDKALSPTGYDRSAEIMRNVAGEGYAMQRADVKDPLLPRILVIGDSISMGYRGFISKHFKGQAYVDYWVGGGWLDPNSVKGENSKVKTSWSGVLSNGPYNVISWNSMTLHMWTPAQPGRCLESNHADNVAEVIEHIRKTSPGSKLIWIRCTPYTTPVADASSLLDEKKSERLVKFNKITDEVMTRYSIPEVDLYALCEKNLDKASKDGVHWQSDAYRLMADEIIKQIEKSLPQKTKQVPQTFAFETYAGRAYNCLEAMPDKDGMPYFNIFWTDPAEAGHAGGIDGPDVVSRLWEASIMVRHMTGRTCSNEKAFAKNTLRFLSPKTGLVVPGTGFLGFAQGVSLHAITVAYADGKDPALLDQIRKTTDNLPSTFDTKDSWRAVPIKSLMNCARVASYPPAAEYAGKLVRACFLFKPNNKKFGGHMHAGLRSLAGAADYALSMKDTALFDQVNAIYLNVMTIPGARFGWLPETAYRGDDLVGCETCAVTDFVSLSTILANNGHPEYWGNVERIVRNQLTENQVVDGSWLKPGDKPDTASSSWREVGSRMVGGFAGWSSPTHLLAYREDDHGRTRAFQNCCAGTGVHAFYIAWKSASRFENGVLSVNMHFDKLLPQAEIRCYQPYKGYLSIALKEACKVRVRVPDFVEVKEVKVSSDKGEVKAAVENGYLELGPRPAGEKIEVTYPVPMKEEEIAIGNPKHRQYHYQVTWKGDTVVRMKPIGEQYKTAYCEGMKKEVDAFYGEEGPGRLYQREYMLKDVVPAPAPLHADDGAFDFWQIPNNRITRLR